MKEKLCAVLIGVALLFAFVFAGCDMDVAVEAPEITAEPQQNQQVTLALGETSVTATLTVTVKGQGISYQWYSYTTVAQYNNQAGTAIPGGTAASYSPEFTNPGTYRYYVMATNKTGSVQSRGVTITVNAEGVAQIPVITQQPLDTTIAKSATAISVIPVSVTVAVSDGGTLSYQWYKNATDSNEDGELIEEDADDSAYTPPITLATEVGTYSYYYVVVTNTLTPTNTTSITSDAAAYTIIAEPTATNTVTVGLTKNQYVRGFGGMDTPWNNVVGLSIDEYEKMYDPEKLGYNMMRMMITAHNADYNTTLDGLLDGTLVHGSEGVLSRPNQVEGMKIVNKYGGYILASPWSPPAVWKTNNSWNGGGRLRTTDYQNYADYLKSVCDIYAERGAPIYAVSIQNEPNFTATYEGCEWSNAEMSNFFAQVGHFTDGTTGRGGGKETPYVLTMNGESANTPTINDTALSNTTARAAIDVLGRHLYGNQTVTLSNLYGKEIWMTEMNKNSGGASGYPNDSTWNYVWKFMNFVDVSIRINSENAFIWWTAKRFYSMIGDGGNSQGINGYGTREGDILPRGYGLAHYARFANDTGRVGVTVSGSATNVNNNTWNEDSPSPKITAFVTLTDDFYEAGVIDRNVRWIDMSLDVSKIKAISLVMFTPSGGTDATGGTNMGTVKIQLPAGFTIGSAEARKTDSTNATSQVVNTALAPESVTIGADGTSAFVTLPARTILSVRLNKAE